MLISVDVHDSIHESKIEIMMLIEISLNWTYSSKQSPPRADQPHTSLSLPSAELAKKFTREEIIPVARHHDQTMEYPWEVIKKAHAVGLLNTHIPEEYGGPGLGLMECSIISEELAYGCSGIQTAMEANGLAEAPLLVSASHETKQKYLGRMTEEPLVAAYCVVSMRIGNDNDEGFEELRWEEGIK